MTNEKKEKLIKQLLDLIREEEQLDLELDRFRDKNITIDLKKRIMTTLHKYNEIKDVTQVVLGHLALATNVSLAELHETYQLPLSDDN